MCSEGFPKHVKKTHLKQHRKICENGSQNEVPKSGTSVVFKGVNPKVSQGASQDPPGTSPGPSKDEKSDAKGFKMESRGNPKLIKSDKNLIKNQSCKLFGQNWF